MSELRAAYAALLLWVPAAVRVLVVAVLLLVLFTKLVPRLLRALGFLIRRLVPTGCELLLLPEYAATRVSRSLLGRPALGADVYGRVLGTVATSAHDLGSGIERVFGRTFRFPRRPVVAGILLVLVLWFIAPLLALGGTPGRLISGWNGDISRVDRWLATGSWEPAARPSPQRSPAPKKSTPAASKKPKKK